MNDIGQTEDLSHIHDLCIHLFARTTSVNCRWTLSLRIAKLVLVDSIAKRAPQAMIDLVSPLRYPTGISDIPEDLRPSNAIVILDGMRLPSKSI